MNRVRQVDYSNDMVAGQMITGLANMIHQSKELAVSQPGDNGQDDSSHSQYYAPLVFSSVQKSDHKQRFQETKTSSTVQNA